MEKLIVEAEGKIVIPPEVIQKRGLHPGDESKLLTEASGAGVSILAGRCELKNILRPTSSYYQSTVLSIDVGRIFRTGAVASAGGGRQRSRFAR